MTEKINWQKELLESGKFNDKFSKNLLENGAKNFMQGIYLGYMYSRWRKIRGLDKDDPIENKGQIIYFQNRTHSPNNLKILPTFLPTLSYKNGLTLPEST